MPAPDAFVVLKKDWRAACEDDVYLSQPPVLAVEVISRANRQRRVEQKIKLYLERGVQQVWVVDPKRRTVLMHDARYPMACQPH